MSNSRIVTLFLSVTLCIAPLGAGAHDQHERRQRAGTHVGPSTGYAFALPEAGSYRLPPIRAAAGGAVLDQDGRRHDLTDLLQGQITVLAFMYTRCGDACPTATLQMSVLQDLAAKEKRLSQQVKLVSMSFDPDHDTPSVMAEHAAHWRSDQAGTPEWHFLTAPDRATLVPMLAAYDQAVGAKLGPDRTGGPLHHIFRAFLIDTSGQIRNIYSLDFLDPELVLNDIRTLIIDLEQDDQSTSRKR
jgi:cytochrome oxidase Cu insertion factor (SCO1/SenC/PrrC family)